MIKVTDALADHRAVTADLCGDITRIWKKNQKNKPKNYKMSYQMTFKNKNEQKLQIELWIDIWKESFKKIKRKKINSYLYECSPPPPFSSNLMECLILTLGLNSSHIWELLTDFMCLEFNYWMIQIHVTTTGIYMSFIFFKDDCT